ncbi:MAG: ScpA family protein [Candidatus Micrarchaeota archaeon]
MSDGHGHEATAEQMLVEEAVGGFGVERPRDSSLESIVQMPTWREVLVEMVYQNEIDPWNVDVCKVANKYLEAVRGLQMDDLRIPANLILAASILLRFKSDMVSLEDEPVQAELDDFIDMGDEEIPQLELSSRIPPKSRISLDDLVGAVQEVMDEAQKRDEKSAVRSLQPKIEPLDHIDIRMSEFKIENEVGRLYEKICSLADSQKLVAFSSLVQKKDRQSVVFTFLPLLFLANDGMVSLSQEPFFGEIFIRLVAKDKSG